MKEAIPKLPLRYRIAPVPDSSLSSKSRNYVRPHPQQMYCVQQHIGGKDDKLHCHGLSYRDGLE